MDAKNRPSTTEQHAVRDTTLVTSSDELSPIEAALMDGCNELYEARQLSDDARASVICDRLWTLLARYDETDGEDHPNPAWARPNQRALALSAMGKVEKAIETEAVALKYADTPRRLEISLDNLADRCVRVGRYDAAVEYFLQALEVAPSSVPVLLTGAQAMYLAGHIEEADAVFASMLDQPAMFERTSVLGAYLDCEDRLRTMARDLPALRAVYEAWDSASREGGAA